MDALLASTAESPVFTATRAPYLLLDAELTIQAANDAYLRATERDADEIVGRYMFDAFPDNPADSTASGTRNLGASLHTVLRRNTAHIMPIQRYDITPTGSAVFVPKTWSPTNSPLADERGRVAGVLHHVEDLSDLAALLQAPPTSGSAGNAAQRLQDPSPVHRLAVAAARYRHDRNRVQQENLRLRDALTAMAASRGGMGAHPHAVARRPQLWRQVAGSAGNYHWSGWAGTLCAVAVDALESVTGAALSVSTATGGRQLIAVSDAWTRCVEELDHRLTEGPAHAAQLAGVPVHVSDVSYEHHLWPTYSRAAIDMGLLSVSAFPLALGSSSLGTFTVYRRHEKAVGETEWTDTALLADLAVAALLADQERVECQVLEGAGRHSDLGAAVGAVAVALDVSFDEALNRLRFYAQTLNQAITDIADDVIRGNLQIH